MRYLQIITLGLYVFFAGCEKHETLPDLEPNQNIIVPPPPPLPYGGNVMVVLDSSRIIPNGTASNFILSVYISVNENVLQVMGLSYSKIRIYDIYTTYGDLPKPIKTFSRIVNSGQIYRYRFAMIDSLGSISAKSPQYTIPIP